MFFVRIDGVDDRDLAFLGFTLISEDAYSKLYRDYGGDDHLVDKEKPYLLIEDVNDAQAIAQISGAKEIVNLPLKRA